MADLVPGDRFSVQIGYSSADAKKAGKYYYNSDRIPESHVASFDELDDLYAGKSSPSVQALIDSCIQRGFALEGDEPPPEQSTLIWNLNKKIYQPNIFQQGDWLEVFALDMNWKLGQVRRVVLQAPDDWDYNQSEGKDPPPEMMEVFYAVKGQGLVPQAQVRAPKLGLETIFGSRPWLWQQHCLLQLERRLRIQEGHEYDFTQVKIQRFATRRFDDWLNAVGNEEFKEHFLKQPDITQKLLMSHILTPFELMDEITEDKEKWNFGEGEFSIYTYTSVLGSGCLMFLVALSIQLVGLFILLINALQTQDGEPSTRFFYEDPTDTFDFLGFTLATTNFSRFCPGAAGEDGAGNQEGRILLFLVTLLYLFLIVPDNVFRFYRVTGAYDSTYSRINSLREIIFKQADDSLFQQVGYKVDRYMNTAYVCLIYIVLLFILFSTPNVLDIILNALATEFIYEIDEQLAGADWFDSGNNWLMAGAQQLVIQATLQLQILESIERTCKEYDIDPEMYKQALQGNYGPIKDKKLARLDDENPEYMSKKERLWHMLAQYAAAKGNTEATAQFRKKLEIFGVIERILFMLKIVDNAQFHRFAAYRTWSRWEKILYLPHVPTADAESIAARSVKGSKMALMDIDAVFDHVERSNFEEFLLAIFRVFSLIEFVDMVKLSLRVENYFEVPWRIFDAILQYFSYTVQILFPIYVVTALILFPFCY